MDEEPKTWEDFLRIDAERNRVAALKELFNQVNRGAPQGGQAVGGGQFAFSNPQMTGSLVSPYFSAQAPRKKYMNRYLLPQNYLK